MESLTTKESVLEKLTDICREGKKCTSTVALYLECQLPLPYVHLISWVINLYQVTLAIVSGMIVACALDQENEQAVVIQFVIFLYTTLFIKEP
eukprot:UN08093